MRFYYSFNSKKEILYTPNGFTLHLKDGAEQYFDLNGDVDFGTTGGRVKGTIEIRTETDPYDEYRDVTVEELRDYFANTESSTLCLSLFNDEDYDPSDEVTNVSFELQVGDDIFYGKGDAEIV